MDKDNYNKSVNGVNVESEDKYSKYLKWCDLSFVTGSTFMNGTAKKIIIPDKNTVFYGVTCV